MYSDNDFVVIKEDLVIEEIVSGYEKNQNLNSLAPCSPNCQPSCEPVCNPRCSPNCPPCFPWGKCNPQLFR